MSKDTLDISIVVPVYNEEESIPELVAWIKQVLDEEHRSFEVVMVDDGSSDGSWEVIESLSEEYSEVRGVRFTANQGKSAALDAGFRVTSGRVVVTMDADLQDSPDELPDLYKMIVEDGYDLVSGWKKKRFDPLSKTIPTKLYNAATRKMSGINLHDFNCGLKAYNSAVTKNIEVYGEMHRYIPVIAKAKGFKKIGEKVVQHRSRKYGVTKFGYERFIFGFLDLLSITFITRYRKRPMHFFGTLGILSFMIGAFSTFWLLLWKQIRIFQDLPYRDAVDNPLFFLAITFIILGTNLFLAGYMGEMIHLNSGRDSSHLIRDRVGFGDNVEENRL